MAIVSKPSGAVWDFGKLPPSKTIFRGPTEILCRISTFAAWDAEVGVQALRLLCSIDRHWRNVVRSAPEAWAKIHIYNDAFHKQVRGPRKVLCTALDVKEWFERSKNAPLDIALRLRIFSQEDTVFCDLVLDLVRLNATHVHKLSISIIHGESYALRLDRIASAAWPCLRALHLDKMNTRDTAEVLPLLSSRSRAPRLRNFYLSKSGMKGYELLTPQLLEELTHLRISRYSKGEILTNLGLCRPLRVLRIDDFRQPTPWLAVSSQWPGITLPLLECLELCLQRPWYTNSFEAGQLHVPALRKLAIRVSESPSVHRGKVVNFGAACPLECTPIFEQLMLNSNPPLEELELDNAMVEVNEFIPVALRMAGVRKLVWRYGHNVQLVKDLVAALSIPTTTTDGRPVWLFPQLADLYVSLGKNGANNVASRSRRETHAMMQPFFEARTRAPSPFENFRIAEAPDGRRAIEAETGRDVADINCAKASCLQKETLYASVGVEEARGPSTSARTARLESGAFEAVAPPKMVRWHSGESAMKASALHSWEWVEEPVQTTEWLDHAAPFHWDNI